MALFFFLIGLLVEDAGVGIISGLAGFVIGWVSVLPIESRQRRRRPSRRG
jgi:hypothetical protein